MIYSIFSNPSFINIIILALLVFLILFLWRKIMILEGNLFIIDKRVNLLKKDSRESAIAKNIQKANENMQEVFGGDKQSDVCCFGMSCSNSPPIIAECVVTGITSVDSIPVSTQGAIQNNADDDVQIQFVKEDDIVAEMPSIEEIIVDAVVEDNETHDTMSVTSEITFNTETKYSQKKLSKLNIDKLKEICSSLNINSEGTKAQLISRILDNK